VVQSPKVPDQSVFRTEETAGPVRGATVVPEYVERAVKIYGITLVEMDYLTLMSTALAVAIGLCTLFVGLAIPTAAAILLAAPSRTEAVALWGLAGVFVLLAVLSGVAIIPIRKRREDTSARIKRQSRQVPKPQE
jgi:hypothetical protein